MIGYGVVYKPGVRFDVIAPAGFRILEALGATARTFGRVLMITCGTEAHPATDPHTLGEAYDLRTHEFDDAGKDAFLRELVTVLGDGESPTAIGGGLGVAWFWGWIENRGQANEHLHVQRRKGTVYPVTEG